MGLLVVRSAYVHPGVTWLHPGAAWLHPRCRLITPPVSLWCKKGYCWKDDRLCWKIRSACWKNNPVCWTQGGLPRAGRGVCWSQESPMYTQVSHLITPQAPPGLHPQFRLITPPVSSLVQERVWLESSPRACPELLAPQREAGC